MTAIIHTTTMLTDILAETGTVNDGHAIIHKRLDPVTDKWICDGDYGDWNGLFRNTFGIPLNCPENEWNTVEDWKPRKKPESYITVNNDN
jgi:hypothetical protein